MEAALKRALWMAAPALLGSTDIALASEAACYTQRTRPDNVVLPRARSAESLALPELRLPEKPTSANDTVTVVLNVHVTDAGNVSNVVLVEGSAVPAWNAGLLETAKTWAFVPGTVDGEPTAMCFRFRISASLTE
jgi:TonB family protein